MDKTCKYYQYQRYVSYDNGQTWHPMGEYQRGELMEFNSPDCGAGIDAIYKWVEMDINSDYWCDNCDYVPPAIYRWRAASVDDYICSGTTKYYKEYKEESTNSGATWSTVYPLQYRMSNQIIETQSDDCGVYAWRPRPINEEYVCSGDSMYYKEYYQVTYDYGETWEDVIPTSSRTGNMYSECATQCGCGLPMFEANYSDSSSYKVVCGVSGDVITSAITNSYKPISAMTDCLIGNCVTSIDGSAFRYCSGLTSVTIPDSVTSIGRMAFSDCSSLSSVTIGNGVISIGEWAFDDCTSLKSVTIPNSVTSIGGWAFNDCTSLTSVTIPNSVTSIGINAFNYCTSLASIDIPDSVTTIGDYAFIHCRSLTSVTVNAVTPPVLGGDSVFWNAPIESIYVPAESVESYKTASGWSRYADRITSL